PRRELRPGARRAGPRRIPARARARAAHRRGRRWPADARRGGRPQPRRCPGGAGSGTGGAREALKVLALDYGSARTGVAVSDPTGSLARPLCVIERAGTADGLTRLREL